MIGRGGHWGFHDDAGLSEFQGVLALDCVARETLQHSTRVQRVRTRVRSCVLTVRTYVVLTNKGILYVLVHALQYDTGTTYVRTTAS